LFKSWNGCADVDFELTAEESLVRSTARDFLGSHADLPRTRRIMGCVDEPEDLALWREMASRAELPGIAIPEAFGGGGGTLVHLALVFEEMGRVLLRSPYYATVGLAGQALLAAGSDEAQVGFLPQVARSGIRATVAFGETAGGFSRDSVPVFAACERGSWTLGGVCGLVVDGNRADLVLVVARVEGGLGLFAVNGAMPGVARYPLDTIDPARQLSRLEFDGAPTVMVSAGGDATARLESAFALAQVASAAEQLGAAEACLGMSVRHAKTRTQFGRPIATFQAVKHKCADMLLDIEAARMAVYYAAWAAAAAPGELVQAAREARAAAAVALSRAAARNIQIHGGIGYTWEHDAHLFFRRSKAAKFL
jgi:alkylation response protein AidB-like acyl-CoA dehydrogenase